MKTNTFTKMITKATLVLSCLLLTAGAAWSVDYNRMSNDELSQMRGTLGNATQAEWDAFHSEWWKRLSQMSPEEREQYLGPWAKAPGMRGQDMGQGYGRGYGRGPGYGRGQGMGQGYGRGYGMGRGYGRGYGMGWGCCAPCPRANAPAPAPETR
ncbi:MAG: hypothetical protein ACOX5Z_11540 [Desulfobulbus sp.]|jgi:hypothetical protein